MTVDTTPVSTSETAPPPRPAESNTQPAFSMKDLSNFDSILGSSPVPEPPAAPETSNQPTPVPREAEAGTPATPTDEKPVDLEDFMGTRKHFPETAKPTDAKPVETKPEDSAAAPVDNFKGPKELREAYLKEKAARTELEQKIKDLEGRTQSTTDMAKQLEEARKRAEELDTTIKGYDYRKSKEYADTFSKPLERLVKKSIREIQQLPVLEDDGTTRTASEIDFNTLVSFRTVPEAKQWADQRFGEYSREALDIFKEVRGFVAEAEERVTEHRDAWLAQQKDQETFSKAQHEQMVKVWQDSVSAGPKRYPQLYGPDDKDPDGNRLLDEGSKLADTAFSRMEGIPPEERVRLHAEIRNRAAAFPREVARRVRLEKEISSLRERLASFEKSSPSKGTPAGAAPTKPAYKSLMEQTEAELMGMGR
jgi:hypothetical protein